jgi:hypothetical protein
VIKYLLSLFRPNLGRVLAQFDKTALKLEEVSIHYLQQAEKHKAIIASSAAKVEQSEAIATRAQTVKANIQTLLGGE